MYEISLVCVLGQMEEQREDHTAKEYTYSRHCAAAVGLRLEQLAALPGSPHDHALLDQLAQLTLPLALALEDLMANLQQNAVPRSNRTCCCHRRLCGADVTASAAQLLHEHIHIVGAAVWRNLWQLWQLAEWMLRLLRFLHVVILTLQLELKTLAL